MKTASRLQLGRGWLVTARVWLCTAPLAAGGLAFVLARHLAQSSSIRPVDGVAAMIASAITIHVFIDALALCTALKAVSMPQPTTGPEAAQP